MNEICCENECQVSFTMAGKAWGHPRLPKPTHTHTPQLGKLGGTHNCLNHILAGLGPESTTSGPQHTGLGSLDWAPPPHPTLPTPLLPSTNPEFS